MTPYSKRRPFKSLRVSGNGSRQHCTLKAKRLGGLVTESLEDAATTGDNGEGGVKDGGNGAGAGDDVQFSRAVGVAIRE